MLPFQALDAAAQAEEGSLSSQRREAQASNPQGSAPRLTSGKRLARNTLWSLTGFLAPVAVAAVAVPLLIRGIGESRFGVLSIGWIVLGYLGFLDLGLGRALTKLAAEKVGSPDEARIAPIAWTSVVLLLFLGAFGGVIMFAISPWLVYRALNVPGGLQAETLHGFRLLAACIPIVTVTSGLRGLLEALQRFRALSLIRILMSLFLLGGPLLVLPFSHSVVSVFSVLVAGRVIGCVAHLILCLVALPTLRMNFVLETQLISSLLRIGGWMTVSNLLGPVMMYVDRFFIGAALSLTAVAYYTAPFDMLSRLWLIPAALMSVLFPAFAAAFRHQPERAGFLLVRGVKYVSMVVFPVVIVVVTLSPEILRIWLGAAFERNSADVLRWLAAGIFLSCLAQVPFTLIQSAGKPDVTGKLIIIEFPIYLVAVWQMTVHFGIAGTAVAWVGRVGLELVFLFFYASRLFPEQTRFLPKLIAASVGGLIVLYLCTLLRGSWTKVWFLMIALGLLGFAGWYRGLRRDERVFLLGWLR